MELWKNGEVEELIRERKEIQKRWGTIRGKGKREENKTRAFANKIRLGKIARATRSLGPTEE